MQALQHRFSLDSWDTCAVDDTDEAYWDQEKRERLGRTVSAWMAARGVRKAALARDIGIGRGTLDNLIAGSVAPKTETVARVADRLNTTIGTLYDGVMPPETKLQASVRAMEQRDRGASPVGGASEESPLRRALPDDPATEIQRLRTDVRMIRFEIGRTDGRQTMPRVAETIVGRLRGLEGRADDFEDQFDILKQALRSVLGVGLDAAIDQQEARASQAKRKRPEEL